MKTALWLVSILSILSFSAMANPAKISLGSVVLNNAGTQAGSRCGANCLAVDNLNLSHLKFVLKSDLSGKNKGSSLIEWIEVKHQKANGEYVSELIRISAALSPSKNELVWINLDKTHRTPTRKIVQIRVIGKSVDSSKIEVLGLLDHQSFTPTVSTGVQSGAQAGGVGAR